MKYKTVLSLPDNLFERLSEAYKTFNASHHTKKDLERAEKALRLIPSQFFEVKTGSDALQNLVLRLLKLTLPGFQLHMPTLVNSYSLKFYKLLKLLNSAEESVLFVTCLYYRCVALQIQVENLWKEGFSDAEIDPVGKRDWDNEFEEKGKKGIEYGDRALRIIEREKKKHRKKFYDEEDKYWVDYTEINVTMETGNIYLEMSKLDDEYCRPAKERFARVIDLSQRVSDVKLEAKSCYNIAYLNEIQENFDKALEYYNKYLAFCLKFSHWSDAIDGRLMMSDCHVKSSRLELAYRQVNEAKKLLEKLRSSGDPAIEEKEEKVEGNQQYLDELKEETEELEKLLKELDTDSSRYKNLLQLQPADLIRAATLACRTYQITLFFAAFENTFRPSKIEDQSAKPIPETYLTLPLSVKLEPNITPTMASLRPGDGPEQQYPIHNASLHAALVNFLTLKMEWFYEALLEVFEVKRTFMPTRIPLLYKMLTDKYSNVLNAKPEDLNDFILKSVDLANALDDAFDHRKTKEVPLIIEQEFWRVMDMVKVNKNARLMGVILVNLEIIYKKYQDLHMQTQVADAIEKFKNTGKVEDVVIEKRIRFTEGDLRKIKQEDTSKNGLFSGENSITSLNARFICDFKSSSRPVPTPIQSCFDDDRSISNLPRVIAMPKRNRHLSNLATEAMVVKVKSTYGSLAPYIKDGTYCLEINLRSLFESEHVDLSHLSPMQNYHVSLLVDSLCKNLMADRLPVALKLRSLNLTGIEITEKHCQQLEAFGLMGILFEGLISFKHCKAGLTLQTGQIILRRLNRNILECQLGGFFREVHELDELEEVIQIAENLLNYKSIEKLGLEKFGLGGLHGLEFESKTLKSLGLAGNLIGQSAMAWIIISSRLRFKSLEYLDLSRQRGVPGQTVIQGYLLDVAEDYVRELLTSDLSHDRSRGKVLNLRENGDFIRFVINNFGDEIQRSTALWQALRNSLVYFRQILLGDLDKTDSTEFCSMLNHPDAAMGRLDLIFLP